MADPDKPPNTAPPFDAQTAEDIATVLREQLQKLVHGASEDLAYAANRIAMNAVAAAASGDKEALDECHATAKVLLEQHRLAAVGSSWTAVNAVVGAVVKTIAATLGRVGGVA